MIQDRMIFGIDSVPVQYKKEGNPPFYIYPHLSNYQQSFRLSEITIHLLSQLTFMCQTIAITKPPSWKSQIINLHVGGELPFDISHYDSIRSMISGKIKPEYPRRRYSTTKGEKTVTVTRHSDLNPICK